MLRTLFWIIEALLLYPLLPIIGAWNKIGMVRRRTSSAWVQGALVLQTLSAGAVILALLWHDSIGANYSVRRHVIITAFLVTSFLSVLGAAWKSEIRVELGLVGAYLVALWTWLRVETAIR